jgi:PAS domain S-box-containing protein
MKTESLSPDLAPIVQQVFGRADEPMDLVDQRAQQALSDRRAIVWEGDATTFQFSYVGAAAEQVLGYPRRRWTDEPTFWGATVVHPEDRDDAIAYCALATGKCQDHDFVYRAVTADGRIVWLHDIVKVIPGTKGIPERLRGLMIDVTDEMSA